MRGLVLVFLRQIQTPCILLVDDMTREVMRTEEQKERKRKRFRYIDKERERESVCVYILCMREK